MEKYFLIFLIILGLTFDPLRGDDLIGRYAWKPMKIGGGGWVVGLDISPTEKGLIYVRTDVSGAYRWDSDRQNARIEHDKALKRVITAMFKDDAQLFKQFQDNDSFRRWLTDTIFGMTYEE